MTGLFPSGRLDEFARNLARGVARRYPPVIANDPEQTVSQKRVAGILEQVLSTASGLEPLGFFRRALLGKSFKRELKEIGYEEEFVETAAKELTSRLRRASQ